MTVFLENHGKAKTIKLLDKGSVAANIASIRNIEPDRRWQIVDIKYSF
jgi:hypothetical protein